MLPFWFIYLGVTSSPLLRDRFAAGLEKELGHFINVSKVYALDRAVRTTCLSICV